jgi:hypothetical protein
MPNSSNLLISQNVRQNIVKLDLNDSLIASVLGIRGSSFSDLMNNKSHWKAEYLMILSRLFGVSVDDLCFGEKGSKARHLKEISIDVQNKIKKHLIEKKNYESLGLLVERGVFDKP